MFFRTTVDHEGADIKFDLLESGIPEMGQQLIDDGSAIGEAELSANTPVKTGNLKASIRREVSTMRAEIFTTAGYGKPVNDGYPPHIIRAKNAQSLRFVVNGQVVFRKQVFHPGFSGHHFKERTIDILVPKLTQLGQNLLTELKRKVGG